MRNRFFSVLAMLILFPSLGLAVTGCGRLFVYGVYVPIVGAAEEIGDAIGDQIAENRGIAEEKWRENLIKQAENDPGLWKEVRSKLVSRDMAKRFCYSEDEKTCYGLIYVPQKIDLNHVINKIVNMEYIERGGTAMLALLATSGNVDKVEAGKLGMRPIPSQSKRPFREMLVRAALLRRALTEYSVSPRQNAQAMSPPDQNHILMADRLLELDQAIIEEHFDHNKGRPDELYTLYMGMDYELRAYLGPESEFRFFADKAMNHYLSILQRGKGSLPSWSRTDILALLCYDRLTVNESQRLAAVRLLIEKMPNWHITGTYHPIPLIGHVYTDGVWHYKNTENLDIPYIERLWVIMVNSSLIQPSIWDYHKIDWKENWGKQLDEALQQNGKNKEISNLILKAYPRIRAEDWVDPRIIRSQ